MHPTTYLKNKINSSIFFVQIAAGLKAVLDLELFAIAVGVEGDTGVGRINHDLEIITETHHMYLPINAIVLTAHEYEHSPVVPHGKLAPGVEYVTNKPRSGIIRPLKPNAGKTRSKCEILR